MRSSARSAVMRRILRCAREGTPYLHRAAPPAQREPATADHTELAICDQTIDVTYIPLQTSWMYLVAVLDWHSRYVISWGLDDTLQLPFVLAAVKQALRQATP